MLGTTLATQFREIAGQETPVVITMETLGEGESMPWEKRLMPLVVMLTLVFGGSLIPATSLVEEKQKRTLSAVITTSTSLAEIFVAKGLLGCANCHVDEPGDPCNQPGIGLKSASTHRIVIVRGDHGGDLWCHLRSFHQGYQHLVCH
jgi:hypothetical protein